MNYLAFACSDGVATPEKTAAMREHLDPLVEAMQSGEHLVYGHRLKGPEAARTVQVRDGQTLISDGPFTESKEFVAGFDVLRVASATRRWPSRRSIPSAGSTAWSCGRSSRITEMSTAGPRRHSCLPGHRSFGLALEPADTPTTVRVRAGETLMSDGPFVETKEFLAGIVIADLPSIDDATALAAEHPIASYHWLEVRPFWED